jgi:hypothetical protein
VASQSCRTCSAAGSQALASLATACALATGFLAARRGLARRRRALRRRRQSRRRRDAASRALPASEQALSWGASAAGASSAALSAKPSSEQLRGLDWVARRVARSRLVGALQLVDSGALRVVRVVAPNVCLALAVAKAGNALALQHDLQHDCPCTGFAPQLAVLSLLGDRCGVVVFAN